MTKKKKAKKQPVKKQPVKKTKKEPIKKISFLTQRKTVDDKFFDLLNEETKVFGYTDKYGNQKWKRKGIKNFADNLGVTTARINSIIKKGSLKDNGDYLITGIERRFAKSKIAKTKKTTKEYTVHNFTFENFFARKPFGKIKKDEQLYFRCGLYLEFAKKDKHGDFTDVTGYTIQNLPISHHSNLYPQGYKEFFEIIKYRLNDFPSLKLFRFNYFDVKKINVGTIEDRLKKFETKNSKNNKRTAKRKTNAKRKK